MAKILKKKEVSTDVLTLAKERISHIFDLFDHIVVSFSGGKDSTVCLNLTLDEARKRGRLPLDVVFFDEEAIPYETEEYARRVAQNPDIFFRWYCVPIKHRNACSNKSPFWYCWANEDKDLWVRPLPPEALTYVPGYNSDNEDERANIPDISHLLFDAEYQGTVGMILGIRAQESLTRQRAVSHRTEENYIIQSVGSTWKGGNGTVGKNYKNIYKAYPIYDWKTEDVWTAPDVLGWDYNRAYDLLDKAGIAPLQQRCAPPFGEQPMQSLWTFKCCFPELWDKMVDRVPGAKTGALYSKTELYGFGGKYEKPNDMTWEEYIANIISKLHPKYQHIVAENIGNIIKQHYSKTSDPILYNIHPISGIGWKLLCKIAHKGDFKSRYNPVFPAPNTKEFERAVKAYNEEIQLLKEDISL